jgi:predicted Zn-dependent protease
MTDAGYSRSVSGSAEENSRTQWFGSQQVPTYMMTHPAVEERIMPYRHLDGHRKGMG